MESIAVISSYPECDSRQKDRDAALDRRDSLLGALRMLGGSAPPQAIADLLGWQVCTVTVTGNRWKTYFKCRDEWGRPFLAGRTKAVSIELVPALMVGVGAA